MYMSKKKFDEIKAKHSTTIVVDADVGEALAFVQDLLEAEADAIKTCEPHATASIGRLNEAAYSATETIRFPLIRSSRLLVSRKPCAIRSRPLHPMLRQKPSQNRHLQCLKYLRHLLRRKRKIRHQRMTMRRPNGSPMKRRKPSAKQNSKPGRRPKRMPSRPSLHESHP